MTRPAGERGRPPFIGEPARRKAVCAADVAPTYIGTPGIMHPHVSPLTLPTPATPHHFERSDRR